MKIGARTHVSYKVDGEWREEGEVFVMNNKVYAICIDCKKIIRMDKPILRDLHICR